MLGAATRRFWNSIDVVPHAWEDDQLQQIPGLYTPDIPKSLLVEGAVAIARDLARAGGGYRQLRHDIEPFPGSVDVRLIDKDKSSFDNFMRQLAYQHTSAYSQTFAFPGQAAGAGARPVTPRPSAALVQRLREAGVSVPADLETSGLVRTRLNIAGDWASRPTTEAGWAELAAQVAGRLAGLSARARLQPA